MSTRELIQTALLAAMCAAVGYLLAGLPNIELLSATVFASGALTGVRRGALVGAVAEGLYSALNPYGMAPPPLFAAQVLGFAVLGAAGGASRPLLARSRPSLQVAWAAACGFVLTLFYDLLTNSAVYVTAREGSSYAAIVLGGLAFPFPLAHALTNGAGFAVVVPAAWRAANRWVRA